eukprot:352421-Chlamydomonas_euryale.AAC.45
MHSLAECSDTSTHAAVCVIAASARNQWAVARPAALVASTSHDGYITSPASSSCEGAYSFSSSTHSSDAWGGRARQQRASSLASWGCLSVIALSRVHGCVLAAPRPAQARVCVHAYTRRPKRPFISQCNGSKAASAPAASAALPRVAGWTATPPAQVRAARAPAPPAAACTACAGAWCRP